MHTINVLRKKLVNQLGMLVHIFSHRTWQTDAGLSLSLKPAQSTQQIPGQPQLFSKESPQKQTNITSQKLSTCQPLSQQVQGPEYSRHQSPHNKSFFCLICTQVHFSHSHMLCVCLFFSILIIGFICVVLGHFCYYFSVVEDNVVFTRPVVQGGYSRAVHVSLGSELLSVTPMLNLSR